MRLVLGFIGIFLVCGCGGDDSGGGSASDGGGSGGSQQTGGTSSGGTGGTAGTPASGGTPGSGGGAGAIGGAGGATGGAGGASGGSAGAAGGAGGSGGSGGSGAGGTGGSGGSGVALIFQTTFDCPDWNQNLGLGDANVCTTGDGISGWGGWVSNNGSVDQITALANNPAGGGGKGFRHFRGDGTNNGGGGVHINLPAPVTEMWVRMYMKYSLGFQWTFAPDAHPHYTKDQYWNVGGAGSMVFGYQGGAWGIYANSTAHPSSLKWYASQGNSYVGDGKFHSYEFHLKQAGSSGVVEIWVDGVQYLSKTGVDLGSTPWAHFALGENQNEPTGGGSTDYYTDYDDLAISTVGYIGP